jgi:hypothetical protein
MTTMLRARRKFPWGAFIFRWSLISNEIASFSRYLKGELVYLLSLCALVVENLLWQSSGGNQNLVNLHSFKIKYKKIAPNLYTSGGYFCSFLCRVRL